ncbi:MAG: DNA-3-methyladenine glycosylase [Abditibacteriota bacterium]|jgi:DNA-3-methyladenine glycosylase|nr:DNA-3-methyladenine glycosylase [Abditibacteriota bacterium]
MTNLSFKLLPREFYEPSAAEVAPLLLGHFLLRQTSQGICGGEIVETEAYLTDDPACHAYRRETTRNKAMWGKPGRAYVYQIYGAYFCVNAVCRPHGVAEAVLVRAVRPTFGVDILRAHRVVAKERDLTNGPGKLCAAMQIDRALDEVDLCDTASPLWIARNPQQAGFVKTVGPLVTTTRIGITQAADWPLRFYLDRDEWVSRRLRRAR